MGQIIITIAISVSIFEKVELLLATVAAGDLFRLNDVVPGYISKRTSSLCRFDTIIIIIIFQLSEY